MARLQCLSSLGSDRRSRSFKTSSEDDSYESGLSVREEIRFRVSQMDEERRKTNQRMVKLRQKIESRRIGVAKIISSLGLVVNQRNAPPPSLAQLRGAVKALEERKCACQRDLDECLRSDAYCLGRELEADVIDGHCEYLRLHRCIDDAKQYEVVIGKDVDEAKRRLAEKETDKREIEGMMRSIEEMRKALAACSLREEFGEGESEEAVASEIARLDSTLSAEKMSASTAMDNARESSKLLHEVAKGAEERLRAAMKRQREKK